MRHNNKVKDIAYMGIYLSLFMMVGLIPQVGLIYIPPVYLTTLPIIMFAIIFIHQDFKFSLFAGLAFGFTSLFLAAVRPIGSKDWLYLNPLISIFPRVIWSILTYFLILIGPKKWLKIVWLIIVIFVTYWIHAFISDIFKFIFFVWVGGYNWHNDSLIYSLGLIWGVEHLIEVAIYCIVIPFIFIKTYTMFIPVKSSKPLAIFDFSRTIAFGEGKERRIPENILNHLNKLSKTHSIVVITGRNENKVHEELSKIKYFALISKNGKNITINNKKYIGYLNVSIFSRFFAIKLVESIAKNRIGMVVTDNKNDRLWAYSKAFYTVESHPRIYKDKQIYKF